MLPIENTDSESARLACVSQKTRKLLGPRNRPAKVPKGLSGVSQSTRKILSPKNTSFFPVNFTGTHYLPKSVFSCTCLIKWRPPTYFLGQNKRQCSCIKRERVEEGRENNVVRKYGLQLTDKFQNINIECDAKARGIFILVKLYEVNSIFSAVSSLQNLPNLFNSWAKQSLIKCLMTEVKNCRIQPKKNIYKPLFHQIFKTSKQRQHAIQRVLRKYYILQTPAFNTYIKLSLHS